MLNDHTSMPLIDKKVKGESTFSRNVKAEMLKAIDERLATSPPVMAEYKQQNLLNRMQTSFNYGRRTPIGNNDGEDAEYGYADEFVLYAVLLAQAVVKPLKITLCIRNMQLADLLIKLFKQIFNIVPEIQENKSSITFMIRRSREKKRILDYLQAYFGYDCNTGSVRFNRQNLELAERRSFLQGIFLACGSLADPQMTYQLEFILKNKALADVCSYLLKSFNIAYRGNIAEVDRKSAKLVVRAGDAVADFLVLLGSQQYLLNFESIRVERQMRGDVNRIVNCDSYNVAKTVNTALRQLEDIRYLQLAAGLESLPDDLRQAAELRLAYPECSLQDLLHESQIKLSKAGLHYRMRKLQELAAQYREKSQLATDDNDVEG